MAQEEGEKKLSILKLGKKEVYKSIISIAAFMRLPI